ncbi:MAG: HEAT repeat domain-containing protein [Bacteroidota bacterium]
MKKEHVIDLLEGYLDNTLIQKEKEDVANHLKTCTTCTKELQELQVLMNAFRNEPKAIPSNRVRVTFFEQIESEKQQATKAISLHAKGNNTKWPRLFRIAAGIALLIGAYGLGSYTQALKSEHQIAVLENDALKIKQTAMLSLLENKSASKRIQGVNYVESFPTADNTIIKALAGRMLNDDNVNVRLTAMEALSRFSHTEIAKQVFIEALQTEKDPSIQIGIIQILVQMQEKNAIAPMQKLLKSEDTQPFIKEQITILLPQIII